MELTKDILYEELEQGVAIKKNLSNFKEIDRMYLISCGSCMQSNIK